MLILKLDGTDSVCYNAGPYSDIWKVHISFTSIIFINPLIYSCDERN